jgi:hypothetical protein
MNDLRAGRTDDRRLMPEEMCFMRRTTGHILSDHRGNEEVRALKVFENRVLRRIFGPKRDEIVRVWRKLHNGHHKVFLSNVIRMIKSRRMR